MTTITTHELQRVTLDVSQSNKLPLDLSSLDCVAPATIGMFVFATFLTHT